MWHNLITPLYHIPKSSNRNKSRRLFSSAEMFKKPLWQTVWTKIRLLLFAFIFKFVSNARQLFAADDFSRRHFSDAFFLTNQVTGLPTCLWIIFIFPMGCPPKMGYVKQNFLIWEKTVETGIWWSHPCLHFLTKCLIGQITTGPSGLKLLVWVLFKAYIYRYLLKAGHVPGDTWGGAKFGPRGVMWTNLVEVH